MSLSVQFLSLLSMIGTGIVSAAFIDMIKIATSHAGRKSVIKRYAVLLEVIGWVIVGCWTFYILFLVRDGAWRIYDPFAQLSGLLLYVSFFHKPLRFLGRIILVIVIRPLWFIVRFIGLVIKRVFRLLLSGLALLFRPFVKLYHKHFRKLFIKRKK
ncbi:spore cortex biosynthesis protein YabQ [Sporosarcina siberiensis]|uniref:Spore cortex biosynthesis protein YabQ n=1 Tax=Sporosarcina siberiensis TaxID=1365606 RepID=A0ABW4SB36_9BACL